VAKTKPHADTTISLNFVRTGSPWIDAGVVGLYRVLMGYPSYAATVSGADMKLPGSAAHPTVSAKLECDGLILHGRLDELRNCLERAYERLIDCYFNLSSKNQKEDKDRYNFFYNSQTDCFVPFPKKRADGVGVGTLFAAAAHATGSIIKWVKEADDEGKPKPRPGKLPPEYAELQAKLEVFIAQSSLKLGEKSLLLDGENKVGPKVDIDAIFKTSTSAKTCFLTGVPEYGSTIEATSTAFPLINPNRSFINSTSDKLHISAKADFVTKFVAAVTFFYSRDHNLHLFFPSANNLRSINKMVTQLQYMVGLDDNLYRNLDLPFEAYLQGRSEVLVAFLYRVFTKLSEQKAASAPSVPILFENDSEPLFDDSDSPIDSTIPETLAEEIISAEAVYEAALFHGPVTFTIVSAYKKGKQRYVVRDFWTFHDLAYLSRLFEKMLQTVQVASGRRKICCSPKAFMNTLIDFEAKQHEAVFRDKVCEAILNKRSVLSLLERHAYRIYTQSEPDKPRRVEPLLDFAVLYEVERYEGTSMQKENYEKMVKTARWLGENIADGVIQAIRDPKRNESKGRAKGVFFRLRKTRTTTAFLDELARLQTRYYPEIDLPKDFFEPALFNQATFEEFRAFCVVAALNRFQWKSRTKE
jgi:hypothetical protein